MGITSQVLGRPFADMAVYVQVATGQRMHRLLVDCGEGCPARLARADLQAVDHLFFSHLHMDHVAGFDTFLRANYCRTDPPVSVWGPPGTADILHHRLQGFLWNLALGTPGHWRVSDIGTEAVTSWWFDLTDGFTTRRPADPPVATGGELEVGEGYSVRPLTLDHRTPSLAYRFDERPRANIDREVLREMGVPDGPWLGRVKDSRADPVEMVDAGPVRLPIGVWRERLLRVTPGDSLAVCTDFRLDDVTLERLIPFLRGCRTLVCEASYLEAQTDLAVVNHHLTAAQAGRLARAAGVERLVLTHLSERYQSLGLRPFLEEAGRWFPAVELPAGWGSPLDSTPPAAGPG